LIQDTKKLPIASTCFNILKLPPYDSFETLKDKLLKAITMGGKGIYLT